MVIIYKKATMETLAPLLFLLPSALQIFSNYLVDKFEVKYGNWIVFLSFFGFFAIMFWLQQNSTQKTVAIAGEVQCGNGAAFMALILILMIGFTIFTQILYLLLHWAFARKEY
jgi:hypothetical protein